MPTLYAAAYLAPSRRKLPDAPSDVAGAFYTAVARSTFPYDIGDDPSFFVSDYHQSPVTWGVCRPDVRGMISPGDWMVFFSAERDDQPVPTTRYRFVAALPVEVKLTHVEVYASDLGTPYRRYLNLLIRPHGTGWEHFEPGLNSSQWHDDWMWRICERRGLRKAAVVAASTSHSAGGALALGDRPLPLAANYVIFSTASSVLAQDPPLVATYRRGDAAERWEDDRRSVEIRRLVFGSSPRGLRTTNRQQPHRHFRRWLSEPDWVDALRAALVD